MKVQANRVPHKTVFDKVVDFLQKYAYFETLLIVGLYLFIGYSIDPNDICILDAEISFLLILLAIITLFHGFENGILAMGIIAFFMWYFYDTFNYVEFLMALMMTMIYSQFYYFWTGKIKAAQTLSDYRGIKLDELTKAFYTLKISHEQLEKNYVVKPMSIRHSIEYIVTKGSEIEGDESITDKTKAYYEQFIKLLEKSFNVESALILYVESEDLTPPLFIEENVHIALGAKAEAEGVKELLEEYLVDQALAHKMPIFISNELGSPKKDEEANSDYLAAIPALQDEQVVSILLIRDMPFMAFNRENLTSITILLEYFNIEIRNRNILDQFDEISRVPSENFRFEYSRLKYLYKRYKVNSIVLTLRIDNELQAIQIFEKIQKMLRALDMVDMLSSHGMYYIVLLFPLHDKAAALGFLNRLHVTLNKERQEESKEGRALGKYKDFEYMTFNLAETELFNKYISANYDS